MTFFDKYFGLELKNFGMNSTSQPRESLKKAFNSAEANTIVVSRKGSESILPVANL